MTAGRRARLNVRGGCVLQSAYCILQSAYCRVQWGECILDGA